MVSLTDNPIDPATILANVASREAGAVVLFLGTTRELTHGRRTASLDYECYPEMAEKKLAELEAEARQPLAAHRLLDRAPAGPSGARRSQHRNRRQLAAPARRLRRRPMAH